MSHPAVPSIGSNITNHYDGHWLRPVDQTSTVAWDELVAALSASRTFWLTAIDRAGHPHTRPVFAVQARGNVYVSSSRPAAKSTSLAITRTGVDIVWSGTSRPGVGPGELSAVAEAYRSTYGWGVSVDGRRPDRTVRRTNGGPPPYDVSAIARAQCMQSVPTSPSPAARRAGIVRTHDRPPAGRAEPVLCAFR